jgi:alpha-tubulin suppressor-like RCC1 family protein
MTTINRHIQFNRGSLDEYKSSSLVPSSGEPVAHPFNNAKFHETDNKQVITASMVSRVGTGSASVVNLNYNITNQFLQVYKVKISSLAVSTSWADQPLAGSSNTFFSVGGTWQTLTSEIVKSWNAYSISTDIANDYENADIYTYSHVNPMVITADAPNQDIQLVPVLDNNRELKLKLKGDSARTASNVYINIFIYQPFIDLSVPVPITSPAIELLGESYYIGFGSSNFGQLGLGDYGQNYFEPRSLFVTDSNEAMSKIIHNDNSNAEVTPKPAIGKRHVILPYITPAQSNNFNATVFNSGHPADQFYVAGNNQYGQLGQTAASLSKSSSFVSKELNQPTYINKIDDEEFSIDSLTNASGIIKVVANNHSTAFIALQDDPTDNTKQLKMLYTFGENSYSQLGLGDTVNKEEPTLVPTFYRNVVEKYFEFETAPSSKTVLVSNRTNVLTGGTILDKIHYKVIGAGTSYVNTAAGSLQGYLQYHNEIGYFNYGSTSISTTTSSQSHTVASNMSDTRPVYSINESIGFNTAESVRSQFNRDYWTNLDQYTIDDVETAYIVYYPNPNASFNTTNPCWIIVKGDSSKMWPGTAEMSYYDRTRENFTRLDHEVYQSDILYYCESSAATPPLTGWQVSNGTAPAPTLEQSAVGLSFLSVEDVTLGHIHGLLCSDTELYAWGNNVYGQCGKSTTVFNTLSQPTLVLEDSDGIDGVFSGSFHSFYLANSRTELYSFGKNEFGQLGLRHKNNVSTPEPIQLSDPDAVALNPFPANTTVQFTNRVDNEGNTINQIGFNGSSSRKYLLGRPVGSRGNQKYRFIDVPENRALAFQGVPTSQVTGTTFKTCRQINGVDLNFYYGNIEITTDITAPITIHTCEENVDIGGTNILAPFYDDNYKFVDVQGGANHTVILVEDVQQSKNIVFTCGDNTHGQLGAGDNVSRDYLHPIPGYWRSIAAGDDHTVLVSEDYGTFVMGDNSKGQLGLQDTNIQTVNSPIEVENALTPVGTAEAYAGNESSIIISNPSSS